MTERLLQFESLSLFPRAGVSALLRLRQRLEASLGLKACYALTACSEVESERTLYGDLAEPEVGRWEDATDDDLVLPAVLGNDASIAVSVADEEFQDILRLLRCNLASLISEAPAHRRPERRCVDELNHSPGAPEPCGS